MIIVIAQEFFMWIAAQSAAAAACMERTSMRHIPAGKGKDVRNRKKTQEEQCGRGACGDGSAYCPDRNLGGISGRTDTA